MSNRAEERRRRRQERTRTSGTSSQSNTFRWILVGVAVFAVAIVIWNVAFSTAAEGAREPVDLAGIPAEELVALAEPAELGDPNAPVTVLDFSDYQCPSCAAFTAQGKPYLESNYVDEGLVKFEYYDFPLGSFPHSFLAARAARCAGDQGSYWEYHDRLFANQGQWGRQADPFSDFVDHAADLGLDRGEFRTCLGSDRFADVVTANRQLGQQLGVTGTPTLLVHAGDGRAERIQDWSPAGISTQVDAALERAGYEGEDESGDGADTGAGADTGDGSDTADGGQE